MKAKKEPEKPERKKKPAWEKLPIMETKATKDQDFKNLLGDYPRESINFFAADATKNWPDPQEIIPIRVLDAQTLEEALR